MAYGGTRNKKDEVIAGEVRTKLAKFMMDEFENLPTYFAKIPDTQKADFLMKVIQMLVPRPSVSKDAGGGKESLLDIIMKLESAKHAEIKN